MNTINNGFDSVYQESEGPILIDVIREARERGVTVEELVADIKREWAARSGYGVENVAPPTLAELATYTVKVRPHESTTVVMFHPADVYEIELYEIEVRTDEQTIFVQHYISDHHRYAWQVVRRLADDHVADLRSGVRDFDGWTVDGASWSWKAVETGPAHECQAPGCARRGEWVVTESTVLDEHLCETDTTERMDDHGVKIDFNSLQGRWSISIARWDQYSLTQAREGLAAISEGIDIAQRLNDAVEANRSATGSDAGSVAR